MGAARPRSCLMHTPNSTGPPSREGLGQPRNRPPRLRDLEKVCRERQVAGCLLNVMGNCNAKQATGIPPPKVFEAVREKRMGPSGAVGACCGKGNCAFHVNFNRK